jgi:hypothetical protein
MAAWHWAWRHYANIMCQLSNSIEWKQVERESQNSFPLFSSRATPLIIRHVFNEKSILLRFIRIIRDELLTSIESRFIRGAKFKKCVARTFVSNFQGKSKLTNLLPKQNFQPLIYWRFFFAEKKRRALNENLLLAHLQGSAGVVSGGAGEAKLKGRLRPSFTDKSVRQRFAKHAQNILEEHIHLLSTSDGPYFGRDVFVTPQRLIVPVGDFNKKVNLAYLC